MNDSVLFYFFYYGTYYEFLLWVVQPFCDISFVIRWFSVCLLLCTFYVDSVGSLRILPRTAIGLFQLECIPLVAAFEQAASHMYQTDYEIFRGPSNVVLIALRV